MLWETIKYCFIEALRPFIYAVAFGGFGGLFLYLRQDALMITCFVFLAITLAWFVVRFRLVILAIIYNRRCYDKVQAAQDMKGVVIEEGGNRTGKSLDGFATLFYKAMAIENYVNRFTKLYRAKKTCEKLHPKEYLEFREINETYKFYQRHPEFITSLVTNVKVKDNFGRESMDLLGSHLIQLDKLPRPCALGLDESRDKVNNDIYKDQDGAYVLINFARLFNQYTGDNSLFVLMEQNSGRAFHGYRDSVCVIKNQKGVRVLLEPVRLLKKLEKYFRKIDKREEPPSYKFAIKVLKLHKRAKRIGVLQLNFTLLGNKESSGEKLSDGILQEYIPCDLPFGYDNRFFRTGYACKDGDIKLSRFKGELQSENQVDDLIRLVDNADGQPVVGYRGKEVKQLYKQRKGIKREVTK